MTTTTRDVRVTALRRFALAITVLNLLGHSVLGFEQSYAQPLVALATTYSLDVLFELLDARARGTQPRFRGGVRNLVDFLLPAHITGLAVGMLLYANDRLAPVAFAAAVAVASKVLFRAPVGAGQRHFLNPSNTGIAATLLLFPAVGIAPPYHFTEGLSGALDWALPAVIIVTGSLLNIRLTRKLPVIAGWLGGFVAQALIRSVVTDAPLAAALLPMTGVAFVLFTFYMLTDPATSPAPPVNQFAFGAAVAVTYGLLVALHVVFGIFFALALVCAARGAGLHLLALARRQPAAGLRVAVPAPATATSGVATAEVDR